MSLRVGETSGPKLRKTCLDDTDDSESDSWKARLTARAVL